MDEQKAKKILSDALNKEEGLYDVAWYLEWLTVEDFATLDGCFEAEELEAIAWWMKNKGKKGERDGKRTCT